MRLQKIIRDIIPLILLVFAQQYTIGQSCIKDSNFYSLTYNGTGNHFIKDAVISPENEVVALGQYDAFSGFVTKFTSQGAVIWSNEFKPDYPHDTWVQYPWYNNTEMLGITAGLDGSFYTFGSSTEHGKSINNTEEPPAHKVGLLFHFDKFGNKISGKYFGNWRTDYSVTNLIQLPNGNMVVYLRSHFTPKISKVLCVNNSGGIIWAAPIQSNSLVYNEIDGANPVMQQLPNGNIVVARIMQRDVADTIWYPFTPPIIIPAPIHYFHLFELNGKDGKLLWENSYQCPTLTNTNVSNTFIPQLKNITPLPNGNLSFLADMYLQLDSGERFYAYKLFTKRVANFIASPDGFNIKLISYYPENGSCSLQNAKASGTNGEQLITARDSATGRSILFKIDSDGQVIWSRSYDDVINSANAKSIGVEKRQQQGYFIFKSDPGLSGINLTITNVLGNTACAESPVKMMTHNGIWPWLVDKVHLADILANIDFRYSSSYSIKQNSYPLSPHTNCQYQFVCCTDVVDSLHPHHISLCENETYQLPDNTLIKTAGQYYATLKTAQGCDSILFYNITNIKSPAHLMATPDTCMKGANAIQLWASDGYDNYLWNNTTLTATPYFTVNNPGIYSVKVTNKCGTKTDSIHVYPDCDFAIYFPNAFTPNKDFLNDILKVPELNKNKFSGLTIYNRYGQIVFRTQNRKEGWDGTFRGIAQENGVYIYFLEMEGFSGKKINQKGTVVLIR